MAVAGMYLVKGDAAQCVEDKVLGFFRILLWATDNCVDPHLVGLRGRHGHFVKPRIQA